MSSPRIASLGFVLILVCAWAFASQSSTERHAPIPAEKIAPPPPSRPMSQLAKDLASPIASTRAEAARELAGATAVPEGIWGDLKRLASDDSERAVRVAAGRTCYLLVIRGVRGGVGSTHDEGPRPIKMDRPRYPPEASQRRITGTVRVLLLINERGNVEDAEIVESIPALDDAALRCVRDWKFKPARKDGKPTLAYAVAPIRFTYESNVIGF